jgi:hypothetical protein
VSAAAPTATGPGKSFDLAEGVVQELSPGPIGERVGQADGCPASLIKMSRFGFGQSGEEGVCGPGGGGQAVFHRPGEGAGRQRPGSALVAGGQTAPGRQQQAMSVNLVPAGPPGSRDDGLQQVFGVGRLPVGEPDVGTRKRGVGAE